MPIDTHQVFKHLKRDNVFTEEQADRLADALSQMDVASATKEDLDEAEERLDNRIDDLEERLDNRIDDLEERLTKHINRLEKKMATEEQLKAVKSDLGKQIEETHSATIRTVVGSVAAVGAVLAVVIPLAIYLLG